MSGKTRRSLVIPVAVAALAGGLAPAALAQSAPAPQVVATGLANPRGITVGPDNRLYVAEAGKGGDGPCQGAPEADAPECIGLSGAITAVDPQSGAKRTVVGKLPSLAPQEGPEAFSAATGPHDVSFNGRRMWWTVGNGGDTARRDGWGPMGAGLGKVYRRGPLGGVQAVADLVAFEQANDPDAGQPGAEGADSNAYGIDAAGTPLVTDAGGNDLLRVKADGSLGVVAVFPFSDAEAPPFLGLPPGTRIPVQPVPTGVARGPYGGVYVAQLTGFPFPVGGANLFRVGANGVVNTTASGYTNLIDVAVGRDGSRYVLSLAKDGLLAAENGPPVGRLVRIPPFGRPRELAAGQLIAPSGVAVADDGDVYVTTQSLSGTDGEVVRVTG